jgi:hypothetical protein
VEWVYTLIALESDLKTVEAISRKEYTIKTFDYDGKKYKQKEAKHLIPKIQEAIREAKEKIHQNDNDIYNYFIKKPKINRKEKASYSFTKISQPMILNTMINISFI